MGTASHARSVPISRADSARVARVVARLGTVQAAKALGIGVTTLDGARQMGSMMPATLVRIRESLDRLEAGPAVAADLDELDGAEVA